MLCNDRDGTRTSRNDDLDPASVGIVAAPENGTATPNEDGTITYAPDKDYNGGDAFKCRVCDNDDPALCDTAAVTMTVSPVNDAPWRWTT